jgi:hypothetical protein
VPVQVRLPAHHAPGPLHHRLGLVVPPEVVEEPGGADVVTIALEVLDDLPYRLLASTAAEGEPRVSVCVDPVAERCPADIRSPTHLGLANHTPSNFGSLWRGWKIELQPCELHVHFII